MSLACHGGRQGEWRSVALLNMVDESGDVGGRQGESGCVAHSFIPFCPPVSLALFSSVLLPAGIFLLHSHVSLSVAVPEWVFPAALSCCFCMRLCHCYRHDNGAGGAFWIDIYHFYKQKREIFSQNILQSHDKAVPLQPLLKKSFDHCNDSYGRLAQLVQSVCLTSRGSGVRIPQRPPGVSPVVPQGIAGEFVFR